jgi:drug/metabolite transporter (DMT)-like permease
MVLLFLNNIVTQSLGPFKIPLVLISFLVLILIFYVIYLRFQKTESGRKNLQKGLNALLVLGSFNLALGMTGQITGIWDMIDAIMEAGDINPEIVMTGIKVSFGATIYGLITFMVAAIVWIVLSFMPGRRKLI